MTEERGGVFGAGAGAVGTDDAGAAGPGLSDTQAVFQPSPIDSAASDSGCVGSPVEV